MTETNEDSGRQNPWQTATVVAVHVETPTAKTFRLRLAQRSPHLAGQHYVVRLTAPDGYTAARSYSIASAPDDSGEVEITVERLPDGEVSTFLHEEVRLGDQLEVRGPIGGWFVWRADRPALLVGGGSGVVPLMAMLRLARGKSVSDLLKVVVSVRDPNHLYYARELPGPEVAVVYSRATPPDFPRPAGRITAEDLGSVAVDATVYLCGSSPFADAMSDLILDQGVAADRIRVERFGPSS